MAITAGTKLGPYEIVTLLGAGGMGEVYRARDTRLDRIVAIKVLPESLAIDADRLLRFEQEARVLSTLSHPNLLAIYDVGKQAEIHYLVSEFLEGQTLRERMGAGSLPQRKVAEYALQIANGLAAAHDKGFVHRDLKPENIFVTRDERVKILDFGLAKHLRDDPNLAGDTTTLSRPAITMPGTVMGTLGYMSPEQVRGEAVGHRSDIFSFGAILYEMVTGKRAFKGESGVETMSAILKDDPPEIDTAQVRVSSGMERIVRHCLEKNPANRFQTARDLAFALGALSGTESTAAVQPGPMPRKRLWLKWVGVGLALLAVAAFVLRLRQTPPRAERLEFAIPVQGEVSHLALSPDGRMLAFVSPDEASGENMLTVQRIGSLVAAILPGTEGANYPFWSRDDVYVAFFAGGKLKKVAAAGGTPPQTLAAAPNARGGSWGERGIIYAPDGGGPLWKVNSDGSNAAPLTDKIFSSTTEVSHRWPVYLPDEDHYLFWAGNFANSSDDRESGIYLSSLAAKKKKLLVLAHSNPGYASGYLYYVDARKGLVASSLDVTEGNVSGEPRFIGQAVGSLLTYWRAFSVSENGTVVYSTGTGPVYSVLTWFDRAGKALGQIGDKGVLANPTISPDGSFVAVDTTDLRANNVDIWIHNLKNASTTRFTFDPAEEVAGTWSRDGHVIAFRRAAADGVSLFLKKAQGLEPEKTILKVSGGTELIPNSWSPDNGEILCTSQPAGGSSDLVVVHVSEGKMVPFLATKANETSGQISPDGRWVAYASDESGDWEIYVTSFPDAAGKWQVSRGGGTEPRWRGDGKEIFYIGPTGTLTAVTVNNEGTFSSGAPSGLFQIHGRAPISSTDLFTYDVAKDGNRFLVNRYVTPQHIAPLTVVLNASAESKK
jgi:eukaryotic-like serine/threonine-protein kinase